MKNLVIFGIEDLAHQIKYCIDHDDDRDIAAFCVDDEYYEKDHLEEIPIVKYSDLSVCFPAKDYEVLLGIGYKGMNEFRKKVFNRLKYDGYNIASYVHSSNLISTEKVGEGNIILEQNLVEPFVNIGKGNLIYCRTVIAHNCMIGDFNTIAGAASIASFVTIDNNCFIGNASCIKDNIHISDYTLVGASAYVNRDSNPYECIAASFSKVLTKKSTHYL